MMHKTSELSGALLDAAVARADGREPEIVPYRVGGGLGITIVRDEPVCTVDVRHFEPSTVWSQGGPIIERERITVVQDARGKDWIAGTEFQTEGGFGGAMERGPTPLIAAMRAFVYAKFGDEVEL